RYFNGDFEMFWGSWSRRIDPHGNIANWLMCEGGANPSTDKYCNKDVHKYLATSKSASCSPSSSPSQPPRFGETMTVRAEALTEKPMHSEPSWFFGRFSGRARGHSADLGSSPL